MQGESTLPCLVPFRTPKQVDLAFSGSLVLVDKHQASDNKCRNFSCYQFLKDDSERAGVEGLATIQQGDNAGCPSPEEVASHLHHKPAALSGTGVLFVAKLE